MEELSEVGILIKDRLKAAEITIDKWIANKKYVDARVSIDLLEDIIETILEEYRKKKGN